MLVFILIYITELLFRYREPVGLGSVCVHTCTPICINLSLCVLSFRATETNGKPSVPSSGH